MKVAKWGVVSVGSGLFVRVSRPTRVINICNLCESCQLSPPPTTNTAQQQTCGLPCASEAPLKEPQSLKSAPLSEVKTVWLLDMSWSFSPWLRRLSQRHADAVGCKWILSTDTRGVRSFEESESVACKVNDNHFCLMRPVCVQGEACVSSLTPTDWSRYRN